MENLCLSEEQRSSTRPLKHSTPLKRPKHSSHPSGLKKFLVKIFFTQIWFRSLLRPNIFGIYFYKYLIITSWRLEMVGKRSYKYYRHFKKSFIERKPNVSHHFQSLIKEFVLWILGWRPSSLQWDWSVFTRVIRGCYVVDMNQIIGIGE